MALPSPLDVGTGTPDAGSLRCAYVALCPPGRRTRSRCDSGAARKLVSLETRSLPLPAPCDRAQSACPPAPRAGGCDAVRSQDWRISTILAMPARTLAA